MAAAPNPGDGNKKSSSAAAASHELAQEMVRMQLQERRQQQQPQQQPQQQQQQQQQQQEHQRQGLPHSPAEVRNMHLIASLVCRAADAEEISGGHSAVARAMAAPSAQALAQATPKMDRQQPFQSLGSGLQLTMVAFSQLRDPLVKDLDFLDVQRYRRPAGGVMVADIPRTDNSDLEDSELVHIINKYLPTLVLRRGRPVASGSYLAKWTRMMLDFVSQNKHLFESGGLLESQAALVSFVGKPDGVSGAMKFLRDALKNEKFTEGRTARHMLEPRGKCIDILDRYIRHADDMYGGLVPHLAELEHKTQQLWQVSRGPRAEEKDAGELQRAQEEARQRQLQEWLEEERPIGRYLLLCRDIVICLRMEESLRKGNELVDTLCVGVADVAEALFRETLAVAEEKEKKGDHENHTNPASAAASAAAPDEAAAVPGTPEAEAAAEARTRNLLLELREARIPQLLRGLFVEKHDTELGDTEADRKGSHTHRVRQRLDRLRRGLDDAKKKLDDALAHPKQWSLVAVGLLSHLAEVKDRLDSFYGHAQQLWETMMRAFLPLRSDSEAQKEQAKRFEKEAQESEQRLAELLREFIFGEGSREEEDSDEDAVPAFSLSDLENEDQDENEDNDENQTEDEQ